MRSSIVLGLLMLSSAAHAAEGMWTLDNLPRAKMQAQYGFSPDAGWVDKVMRASVRLAGGCSGSFVSRDGLVMTNHHCARGCIEQLSSAQRDLVRAGFLAGKREAELRCPEIELNRLEQISDVTEQVKAATRGKDGEAYKAAQDAIGAKLTADCVGADTAKTRCDLVDLYHGGVYQLYRYHRFADTRLVWAPEEAIATFGGDPDNFNFPRFDLDMSLLRAYEDGKPAVVKDFFRFSRNGAAAGEMTVVTGHPGKTDRQLTVAQLEFVRDVQLLNGVVRIAELRGLLTQYGTQSAEAQRVSQGLLFGIENAFKVQSGQLQALQDPELFRRKRADEESLRAYVAGNPALQASTGGAWAAIERAQAAARDLDAEYSQIEATRGYLTRYFNIARTLVRGAEERAKPNAERLPEFAESRLPETEQFLFSPAPIYPEFEKLKFAWSLTKVRERLGPDHAYVKLLLGRESPEQLAERLVKGSTLADVAVRRALWSGGKAAVAQSNDPFIRLALAIDPTARAIRKRYETEVDAVIAKNAELIAAARFAQLGTSVYPDATFTLRLSYGEVKGWPERGAEVPPFTNVGGAFERHTGADPFALPDSWLAAKNKLDPALPFNFVTTNDIIGGNSGSPMINRGAEIVGLVFDGNIHSLGGSFGFDERDNRTVAVHSSLIVEALRKVYGADTLAEEMLGR